MCRPYCIKVLWLVPWNELYVSIIFSSYRSVSANISIKHFITVNSIGSCKPSKHLSCPRSTLVSEMLAELRWQWCLQNETGVTLFGNPYIEISLPKMSWLEFKNLQLLIFNVLAKSLVKLQLKSIELVVEKVGSIFLIHFLVYSHNMFWKFTHWIVMVRQYAHYISSGIYFIKWKCLPSR